MIDWIFVYFFLGSIIHFIYQSIIAPSLRLDVRADLLQLGRKLSDVGSAQVEPGMQCGVSDLRESHKRVLEALDRISIVALLEVERELRDNQRVREQVEARSA